MAPLLRFSFSTLFLLLGHDLMVGVFAVGSPFVELHMKPEESYVGSSALIPLSQPYPADPHLRVNSVDSKEPAGDGYWASASIQGRKWTFFYRLFLKRVIVVVALAATFLILRCAWGNGLSRFSSSNKRSLAVGGEEDDGEEACQDPEGNDNVPQDVPRRSQAEKRVMQRASQIVQGLTSLLYRAVDPLWQMDARWRLSFGGMLLRYTVQEAALLYSVVGIDLAAERAQLAHAIEITADLCLGDTSMMESGHPLMTWLSYLKKKRHGFRLAPMISGLTLSSEERMEALNGLVALQRVSVRMATKKIEVLRSLPSNEAVPLQMAKSVVNEIISLFRGRQAQIQRHTLQRAAFAAVAESHPELLLIASDTIPATPKDLLPVSFKDQVAELQLGLSTASYGSSSSIGTQERVTAEGKAKDDRAAEGSVPWTSPMGRAIRGRWEAEQSTQAHTKISGSSSLQPPLTSSSTLWLPTLPSAVRSEPSRSGPVQHLLWGSAESLAPGAHRSTRPFRGGFLGELAPSLHVAPGAERPTRPFYGMPLGEPRPQHQTGIASLRRIQGSNLPDSSKDSRK